jgi:hypothetical protein
MNHQTPTGNDKTSEKLLDLMKMEWADLRKEQEFLKNCQLRYFILSITVGGLFGGLIRISQDQLQTSLDKYPWVFFSPLLISIPCWWVYFDKAKTIARIVGYLRILEELMLSADTTNQTKFKGWERSLGDFRKEYSKGTLKRNDNIYNFSPLKQFLLVISFRSTHKYWTMHFFAFSVISLVCVILGAGARDQSPNIYWAVVAIFAIVFVVTFRILVKLIFGRNSYYAHEQAWRKILKLETKQHVAREMG